MTSLSKFLAPEIDEHKEFVHDRLFERQVRPNLSRVLLGTAKDEIPLMLDLCRKLQGPFGILYVLLVSRLGNASGRYQSPTPLSHGELESFLLKFKDFFEQDGRHDLWISSLPNDGQFIFDNHNMIYAYGNVQQIVDDLSDLGFKEASVKMPTPHSHCYHPAFDSCEDQLMNMWSWIRHDLHPSDDP